MYSTVEGRRSLVERGKLGSRRTLKTTRLTAIAPIAIAKTTHGPPEFASGTATEVQMPPPMKGSCSMHL